MKKLKILFAFTLILLLGACDVEYFDNPNAPSTAPTSALFNNNVKRMVDATQDMWWSGRFTYVTMQYWQQTEYGDEDRYVYRESMRNYQDLFYRIAENYREIIRLNEDEETMEAAAASGANVNQIATCRVLLAYLFDMMTTTWGDIPYYSYGSDDPDFQALKLSGFATEDQILTPAYASQDKIFADILKELDEAHDMFDESLPGIDADRLYDGDVAKWKKFANSLRLKIAHKIEGVDAATAGPHIADAIAGGVFASNEDNAIFVYETSDATSSPSYAAWNVGNRSDFAVGHSFITLLKGEDLVVHDSVSNTISLVAGANPNPFSGSVDPRLPIYANPNEDGDFVGMFISESSADAATFTKESLPGDAIINTPDFGETLLEYAEIAFILSERGGWDQAQYQEGIVGSCEKWGIDSLPAVAYVGTLPAASEETVLTQKYIALYMQGHSAWTEYRRTGFPKTLIPVFSDFSLYVPFTDTWLYKNFSPLVEEVTDIPYRMRYPQKEQTLNGESRAAAVAGLDNGDVIYSKLWWDVN